MSLLNYISISILIYLGLCCAVRCIGVYMAAGDSGDRGLFARFLMNSLKNVGLPMNLYLEIKMCLMLHSLLLDKRVRNSMIAMERDLEFLSTTVLNDIVSKITPMGYNPHLLILISFLKNSSVSTPLPIEFNPVFATLVIDTVNSNIAKAYEKLNHKPKSISFTDSHYRFALSCILVECCSERYQNTINDISIVNKIMEKYNV